MALDSLGAFTAGAEVTVRLVDVNDVLSCKLCNGYFRNAHTIAECLHTFCRKCIRDYWKQHDEICPLCRTDLGPEPVNILRHDITMQNLVDKLAPPAPTEVASRKVPAAPVAKGEKRKRATAAAKVQPGRNTQRRLEKTSVGQHRTGEDITFQLVHEPTKNADPEQSSAFKALARPFVRTSSKVTVKVLKKYVVHALDSAGSNKGSLIPSQIDIRCLGEVLADEHTLEFISKTRWQARAKPMVLHFGPAPLIGQSKVESSGPQVSVSSSSPAPTS